jgi:hypothetical protein
MAAPVTVQIEPLGSAPYSLPAQDAELIPDNYASSGPVTFDWDPLDDAYYGLRYWYGDYSGGRAAAFCAAGEAFTCSLEMTVTPGTALKLESFFLGSYQDATRTIAYKIIDLTDDNVVAEADPSVGAAGLTVPVNATTTTGFRLVFGPDFFNGGINDIVYSTERLLEQPAAVPAPPALALFGVGLLGLGLARRRRHAG